MTVWTDGTVAGWGSIPPGKAAPAPVHPLDKGVLAAHWATLLYTNLHGKLVYSETGARSRLYDRVKGELGREATSGQIIQQLVASPLAADCSQFVATCEMAAGHEQYTDRDYTGTELTEGVEVPLTSGRPGDYCIYGAGTGEHVDILVAPAGDDWWIIGFGGQGGPGHGLLSGSRAWFEARGYTEFRVLRPK